MKTKTSEYFINDQALVRACLKGTLGAQEQLYDMYSKQMFGLCMRMMGNKPDAEDVFQNAFILVFSKLKTYSASAPLKYWIKRIMVNNCINELKKRKNTLEIEDYIVPAVEHDESPIEYQVESVKAAMASLSTGYRTVLNLYLFEGYDHKEIGSILGISESTSKSQYSRAKAKIKEYLIREKHYEQV